MRTLTRQGISAKSKGVVGLINSDFGEDILSIYEPE